MHFYLLILNYASKLFVDESENTSEDQFKRLGYGGAQMLPHYPRDWGRKIVEF